MADSHHGEKEQRGRRPAGKKEKGGGENAMIKAMYLKLYVFKNI